MILFESNFCSVCISRHPKYPNDKIYPDNKKIKHYFTVNDAQRSYIIQQSFVNLPTVLDHWGVGLHWGYCLGNFSWVQWVLRLSLYTASMPWGQGAAWLRALVTSTRRQHSGARDPAMAGITGTLRARDHRGSLINTLLSLKTSTPWFSGHWTPQHPASRPWLSLSVPRCPHSTVRTLSGRSLTLGSELAARCHRLTVSWHGKPGHCSHAPTIISPDNFYIVRTILSPSLSYLNS